MRFVRLFVASFSVSLRSQLAFRTNLLFQVFTNVVIVASGLGAVGVVYSQTRSLAGWSYGDTVVLLGTFQIVTGLIQALVEPGLTWFGQQVQAGTFDEILVRPAPSMFLVSLCRADPVSLSQAAMGVAVLVLGVTELGSIPGPARFVAWLLLVAAGTVSMWACRVLVSSVALWALGSGQAEVAFSSLWQLGRYPSTIYKPPIRFALTYLLPVGLMSTFPARALAKGAGAGLLLTAGFVAAGSIVVVQVVWRAGLKRYRGATS